MNHSEDTPIANGAIPKGPCGITSILPTLNISMSCKGRAEAFARRLQSRLRTLGSQSVDLTTDEENPIIQTAIGTTATASGNHHSTSWLSSSLDSQITHVQPTLRQISHEADSYFDFDCEPESPGSPASPTDECAYSRLFESSASSVTPTNNDFASESGYICSTPLSQSENESNHENSHSSSSAATTSGSEGQYFDVDNNSDVNDPKSISTTDYFDCDESSTSIKTDDETLNSTVVVVNGYYDKDNESLSDSLPPSQDSTSTTDTSATTPSSYPYNKEQTSSSSDSTLQDIILNELQTQTNELDTKFSNYTHQNGHYYELNESKNENNDKTISNETEISLFEKEVSQQNQLTKTETPSLANIRKNNLSTDIDDDEDYKPQRIQRSSSLKSGKTPPGTPSRKKIVRFADVLGLDLADVKTFLDEIPTIPKSAFEDLEIIENDPLIQLLSGPRSDKILMPLFQQPGGLPTFLDIVRDKQVSLENAIVSDTYNLTISGTVRVRNLDFHKSVYIRYSLDSWKSYADLQANYIENSCDGFSDKFSFVLFGNSLIIGQRIEFAIRFHCKGQQYWDNNYGINYCFQCLPATNNINANKLLSITTAPSTITSSITTATSTPKTTTPTQLQAMTNDSENSSPSTIIFNHTDSMSNSFY